MGCGAVAPCAFSVRRIRIYRLTEIDFDQIERRYRERLCLFLNFTNERLLLLLPSSSNELALSKDNNHPSCTLAITAISACPPRRCTKSKVSSLVSP